MKDNGIVAGTQNQKEVVKVLMGEETNMLTFDDVHNCLENGTFKWSTMRPIENKRDSFNTLVLSEKKFNDEHIVIPFTDMRLKDAKEWKAKNIELLKTRKNIKLSDLDKLQEMVSTIYDNPIVPNMTKNPIKIEKLVIGKVVFTQPMMVVDNVIYIIVPASKITKNHIKYLIDNKLMYQATYSQVVLNDTNINEVVVILIEDSDPYQIVNIKFNISDNTEMVNYLTSLSNSIVSGNMNPLYPNDKIINYSDIV